MSRLHLVSWNVAGWRTALDEITPARRDGARRPQLKKIEEKQACVATWLERLDADIICLQETKLTSEASGTGRLSFVRVGRRRRVAVAGVQ